MQQTKAIRRHIDSIRTDLIERYKTWIEVALADMKDNTELTQLSMEGFKSDLDQLIGLAQQLGKLEQTREGSQEK